MKTIIIEDEKLSADHLIHLLEKIDKTIEVVDTFDSVKNSISYFQNTTNIDLLFVDIHLADGISFDIFSKIAIEIPVIFTTAYNEYAIKAFQLNSIDYLLKPIGIDELRAAIEKHHKLKKNMSVNFLENITNAYHLINNQHKNRFMVKMGDAITSIKSIDIAHFVAEDGIVLIATNEGKRYPVDYTLDQSESLLDPSLFFRINRKIIININSIKKVSAYFNSRLKISSIILQNDDCIVSRERVNDFKLWLDK